MSQYHWAANKEKLNRAIGELGPDASEEAIKSRYIEMAGKVLTDEGGAVVDVVLEDEAEKPKKAAKKK